MAIGPKEFTTKREQEFCEIEKIIDAAIERKTDETNVHINANKLPSIHYHFDRVRDLYKQVGWKNVLINTSNDFRETYEVLELVR